MEPEKRRSAQRALTGAVFKAAEDPTETTVGFRQVGKCIVKEKTLTTDRTYELRVKNLCSLNIDEEVESKIFEIGGKKWKIGLLLCEHNSGLYEIVKVVLMSCNGGAVGAHVSLDVQLNGHPIHEAVAEREWRVASDFDVIRRCDIDIHKETPSGEFQADDELVITADLKDVSDAGIEEQCSNRRGRTVHLEIIEGDSIKAWLNRGSAFGIAQSDRVRHSDICGRSLIRLWSMRSPDRRYWLCKRDRDGFVTVKRYLNEAGLLERFEDIGTEENGGCPWVTVFEERKISSSHFQPFDENSLILFCKLFKPPFKDLSYLGHLVVQKTTPCQDILSRIARDMAKLPNGTRYDAYVEREGQHIEDITSVLSPMPDFGESVGLVIILRERESDGRELSVQEVEQNLRTIQFTES